MTQIIKASDVRAHWRKLLNKVFRGETDVVVEKSGIPVAAIVSTQDYEQLQRIKQQRQRDFALLNDIRAAFADQTPEQIAQGVAESIVEAREERGREKTPASNV